MLNRMASAVLAVGIMVFSPWAIAQDEVLTGDQIKAAWSGKKLFIRSTTSGLLDLSLHADGTAAFSVGNFSDTGTWRTTDNGYCAKWQKLRQGAEACFKVIKRDGKTLTLDEAGKVTGEVLRVI
ncbi:MAG TPA: hypothetical protein VEA35_06240 [Ramlibacter sp.]|nr:hypothetical protein [Ramlibacter sp.]